MLLTTAFTCPVLKRSPKAAPREDLSSAIPGPARPVAGDCRVLARDRVRRVLADSGERSVAPAEDGVRCARLGRRDAVDLPAVQELVRKSGKAADSRQLPDVGNYETVRHVVVREPFVEEEIERVARAAVALASKGLDVEVLGPDVGPEEGHAATELPVNRDLQRVEARPQAVVFDLDRSIAGEVLVPGC